MFRRWLRIFAVPKSTIVTLRDGPAFVQISSGQGELCTPATRLMDVGQGLDPYTTHSSEREPYLSARPEPCN